jgi:hypothetical protein
MVLAVMFSTLRFVSRRSEPTGCQFVIATGKYEPPRGSSWLINDSMEPRWRASRDVKFDANISLALLSHFSQRGNHKAIVTSVYSFNPVINPMSHEYRFGYYCGPLRAL